MKKTLSNAEIEYCWITLNSKDSFRRKINIKVPGNMDWSVRVNLKNIANIYNLFKEACTELGQRYVDSDKTNGNKIKKEYLNEYLKELNELRTQENEISLRPLKINEVFELDGLSSAERDALMMMCLDEEIEKYFSIDDEAS